MPPPTHTILIVDDEPDLLLLTRRRLEASGFRVLGATDGPEGLEVARRERPDLVLLDVMLPGLSGYEVCKTIKTDEATRHIPVFILSARAAAADAVAEEHQAGFGPAADGYISKPYSARDLIDRIRSVLGLPEEGR